MGPICHVNIFHKSMNFIKKSIEKFLTFQTRVLKVGLSGMEAVKNTKFLLNISKIILARPKKHRDMECEYRCSNTFI